MRKRVIGVQRNFSLSDELTLLNEYYVSSLLIVPLSLKSTPHTGPIRTKRWRIMLSRCFCQNYVKLNSRNDYVRSLSSGESKVLFFQFWFHVKIWLEGKPWNFHTVCDANFASFRHHVQESRWWSLSNRGIKRNDDG